MTFKTKGIVLKEASSGENGKLITLLTPQMGKINASAMGAKSIKSKLLASTQPFSFSDFVIEKKSRFFNIVQADLIESFYGLRTDITKLSYCMYFMELADKTFFEGMDAKDLLNIIFRTFRIIQNSEYPPKQAARVFELKYMQLAGYMPILSSCAICGEQNGQIMYFSALSGGVVCQKCSKSINDCQPIQSGVLSAMKYILSAPDNKMFSFKLDEHVLKGLTNVNKKYMSALLDTSFKTLDFAESQEC